MSVGSNSFYMAPWIEKTDTETFQSPVFSNAGYDMEENEPINYRYRSAWWRYRPAVDGAVTLNNFRGSGDLLLYLYEIPVEAPQIIENLIEIGQSDDEDGTPRSRIESAPVTTDKIYYIQIIAYNDEDLDYALDLVGPASYVDENVEPAQELNITLPAFDDMYADILSLTVTVSDITVSEHSATLPALQDVYAEIFTPIVQVIDIIDIELPAFQDIYAEILSPVISSAQILSVSPDSNAVVPTDVNVQFTFVLQVDNDSTSVEVQMDDNAQFSSPYSSTVLVEDQVGAETVKVPLPEKLEPNKVYHWRYRLHMGEVVSGWSTTRTLALDANLGALNIEASWTVVGDHPDPVIWFLFPASGLAGDKITIFGSGLNKPNAVVKVGTVTATITDKISEPEDEILPAIIDEASGVVTVAHDEITFVVPDIDPPGKNVTVIT